MLRELLGDLRAVVGTSPLWPVDPGEFLELLVGQLGELAPLLRDERALGVALAAHRDVLAERHRDRAADEAGDAGGEDGPRAVAPATPTTSAGDRDDPVVRAEHARAEPVEPLTRSAGVRLAVVHRRVHVFSQQWFVARDVTLVPASL